MSSGAVLNDPLRPAAESPAETPVSAKLSSRPTARSFLLRRFWKSAIGFWGGAGISGARVFSAALLASIVFNLGMLYANNLWNRKIFDGLQTHDSSAVLFLSLIYVPLFLAIVASNVVQVYVRMSLERRWRAWLNDHLIDQWLANGRYYLLNLVSGDHKNPEFRIAEDLRVATESPIEFVTGVMTAFLSAATFVVVLWTIGGTFAFDIGAKHIILSGEGYSLMWPEGDAPRRYEWQVGTMIVPPNMWLHQHFNSGTAPARYLAFKHEVVSIRNAQGVPKAWISRRIGGDQIDYADEAPEIRTTFAEALAKNGLVPRMDAAYQAELVDLPPLPARSVA